VISRVENARLSLDLELGAVFWVDTGASATTTGRIIDPNGKEIPFETDDDLLLSWREGEVICGAVPGTWHLVFDYFQNAIGQDPSPDVVVIDGDERIHGALPCMTAFE
jgi:hypothetical protein